MITIFPQGFAIEYDATLLYQAQGISFDLQAKISNEIGPKYEHKVPPTGPAPPLPQTIERLHTHEKIITTDMVSWCTSKFQECTVTITCKILGFINDGSGSVSDVYDVVKSKNSVTLNFLVYPNTTTAATTTTKAITETLTSNTTWDNASIDAVTSNGTWMTATPGPPASACPWWCSLLAVLAGGGGAGGAAAGYCLWRRRRKRQQSEGTVLVSEESKKSSGILIAL